MEENTRPKRALLAYCSLAQRLNTPGVGIMQALTPFLAEACQKFSGELFDAGKFSLAMSQQYGIEIPRLAALGLAEQLYREGLLELVSDHRSITIYRYATRYVQTAGIESQITEDDVEKVLSSFANYCANDNRLKNLDRTSLDEAFLDRLLNIDSMRILGRKEASIAIKKNIDTLVLSKTSRSSETVNTEELHLDFLTSQFLLDLQRTDQSGFELVSDVAYANMAAETIACFQEPLGGENSLDGLTVYLDSPILLDMLGVNTDYADYGAELLQIIRESGATPSVLDHCVVEAEGAVSAQLAYLRSGINSMSTKWSVSAKPDLLNALSGNVGDRAFKRLRISIERDPEVNLHRRAQVVVGDIESEMNSRMQHWRNVEAKEHDRKSVWSMLSIRDSSQPCPRICDSKWIFLSRNTALVTIANNAWSTWLKGTTKHSHTHIDKWAPISMSDKQFAGYIWARTGGRHSSIPRVRLLANCSAAVRPRADVKARAYNLILELNGKEEADDLAALFEDREGSRALMRATSGDPEDVTQERLPFIIEQVKLAAGEYAAARVREESDRNLEEVGAAHEAELEQLRQTVTEIEDTKEENERENTRVLLQKDIEQQELSVENMRLKKELKEKTKSEALRKISILQSAMTIGLKNYRIMRWGVTLLFAVIAAFGTYISTDMPIIAAVLSFFLAGAGFWFVPNLLHRPISWFALGKLRNYVLNKDETISVPVPYPDFQGAHWQGLELIKSELNVLADEKNE